MEQAILEKLKEVRDPEIPLDIVNLGLIYGVQIKGNVAYIDMTLTVQGCPAKNYFAQHVREHILKSFPELKDVVVNFVFEPPWSKDKISEEGKEKLRSLGWNI
ncbi:metal-sulfur cluster assembly factor [Thermocrinis minervae]|uniref:Metal-sulfur cluster biosynthetic enzyme n=1 Tax=Thermocrinis minervae TaxID=381751 RepID=A0A1M6SX74_9AQUI|nr:metal-sulfur cluster assembly factor [Thermocrinis minervae]SHK49250.1 Metal-sulfur cluster biosynthetic enzyme [Thermocrinis minervae]